MAHSPHRQALLCLLSRNMVADLERRARLTLRPLARPGSRRSFFASFSLSKFTRRSLLARSGAVLRFLPLSLWLFFGVDPNLGYAIGVFNLGTGNP